MTDVILINPITSLSELTTLQERKNLVLSPPLGLLYIAAVLEKEGYSCRVIDMESSLSSRSRLAHVLEKDEAPVVGIGLCTPAFGSALESAQTVKQCFPDATVICGGAHSTLKSEEVLGHPVFDIAVRGEGEHTMVELVRYLLEGKGDLKDVTGITYRTDNTIQMTPDRPFIEELDSIPFPARHLVDIDQYIYGGSLISGRGCQHRCIFCAAGPLSGYRYRVRSPENVVEEMDHIHTVYRLTDFVFVDDCLTAFPERTHNLCRLLKEMEFSPTWTCESRVNTVTPELLKDMADAGCVRIQFGCESGSDPILKSIKKGITVEQIEKAVSWTTQNGIMAICSFIIGHPEDTRETVQQTIDLCQRLLQIGGEDNVIFQFMLAVPLPGTELYQKMDEYGVQMMLTNEDIYDYANPIIETKNLSRKQLRSLLVDAFLGSMVISGEEVSP